MIDEIWASRMTLKNKLEKGHSVLEGGDLEDYMLAEMHEHTDRRMLDNYTKVKAPKKVNDSIREYNAKIKSGLTEEQIKLLLYFARMCSYIGGTGLPDFIVIKKQTDAESASYGINVRLIFASGLPEQTVFAELCKAAGFEAEIDAKVSYKDVIIKALERSDLESLETALQEAKRRTDAKGVNLHGNENFIKEAERVVARNPLFLLREFVNSGISIEKIRQHMNLVKKISIEEKLEMMAFERQLKNDEVLTSFGRKKDNETLGSKSDYIAKKYNVSKYKAMEILEFMGQI